MIHVSKLMNRKLLGCLVVAGLCSQGSIAAHAQDSTWLTPLKVFVPNIATKPGSLPETFVAKKFNYDAQSKMVLVEGKVEVEYGNMIVQADSIEYDQVRNIVLARGNVVLLESDGKVKFANSVEIKNQLKDGIVTSFRSNLSENKVFMAAEQKNLAKENRSFANAPKKPEAKPANRDVASNTTISLFDAVLGHLVNNPHDEDPAKFADLVPAAGSDSVNPQEKQDAANIPLITLPEETPPPAPAATSPVIMNNPVPAVPPVQEMQKAAPISEAPVVTVPQVAIPVIEKPGAVVNPTAPALDNALAAVIPTVPVIVPVVAPVAAPVAEAPPMFDNAATAASKAALPATPNAPAAAVNIYDMIQNHGLDSKDVAASQTPKEPTVPEKKEETKITKTEDAPKPKKPTADTKVTKSDRMNASVKKSPVTKDSEPVQQLSKQSRDLLKKVAPVALKKESQQIKPEIKMNHSKDMQDLFKADEYSAQPQNTMGIKVERKMPAISVDSQLEKAYDALNSGQSDVAIETYKEVLDNSPNNTQALFGLATLYHRARQFDKARPLYSRLLAVNPEHRDGFNNFLVMLADEAPNEALSELEKLENKNPGFSTIPAQIAVIYQKLGQQEKAIDKMFRAVSLAPENMIYRYNLAIMLDKQKNYDEAAKLYRQLIEASGRGEKIPGNITNIQQRLTFISSNR